MMQLLVTGSSGLIGSEAVRYFSSRGHGVLGIDNNMRREFFGIQGDTNWNRRLLEAECPSFRHCSIDIRNTDDVFAFFKDAELDAVIHCAAQPSHDKARDIPLVDFGVNAVGTLNLLEATRQFHRDVPFCFMSTNKVYGDAPNELKLQELATRWDYADSEYYNGIAEDFQIDQCLHSLFGASKVAADVMVQEYGRYFGMNTVCFRGGCLTGPRHSGVQLHGFLSYLVKVALSGDTYTIFGYKGKQVRDQIHSVDVIRAMEAYIREPRPGEVYNLGGGRGNSTSIIECLAKIEDLTGKKVNYEYSDQNRMGDHICYITDLTKLQSHYPEWNLSYTLDEILEEMVRAEHDLHVA
jgi:CDP-paratose 2-epimerase